MCCPRCRAYRKPVQRSSHRGDLVGWSTKMSKSHRPRESDPAKEAKQVVDKIYLKPPLEIDRQPPPMANNVRIIGGADSMTLHLYFVSPTQFTNMVEGRPQPGVERHGNIVTIESVPVARVALPISTAVEVAVLIIKNLVEGTPQLQQQLAALGHHIAEIITSAQKPAPTEEPA
jgi:hypothetical protein